MILYMRKLRLKGEKVAELRGEPRSLTLPLKTPHPGSHLSEIFTVLQCSVPQAYRQADGQT